ncbi:hypothetical protein HPB52_012866 [Rhipicephalus sanguineus]|uniref:Cytosolic endo-beta-N-acetylglucosaminidase TIM barrel domain-containing protein n=1 Tax=Rhipicephalus sanguineus TaxID=34632 RepID=A0A9D4PX96_RHISA|nr:hypothetical protein HPB52_012866 [Rhipicephalus sanguineus]
MAHGEVRPLDTLDELLAFRNIHPCVVEKIREVKRGDGQAPRTMFCHDMMGGYHEDRFINGSDKPYGYRFHHWQLIDSFVYYAHHLVTIPPPGWISAGHIHGVKVLGTFSLESLAGIQFINKVRGSRLEKEVASQLARIAALHTFDGWLVSIACRLDRSCIPFVKDFLRLLTEEMHSAVPGSMVIWYDAVVRTGKCARQNELNCKNVPFFDLCDGIFIHFKWTEDMLEDSARYAGDRKNDVYVGIDAVAQARKYGLSAGIFAAGWVYETQDKSKLMENQCRFWNFPEKLCNEWRIVTLPLKTGFCQGFGRNLYKDGKVASHVPWYNLAKQQLQPRDQGTALCGGCCSAIVDTTTAYNGGGCLRLQFEPKKFHVEPYFRLFGCDLRLGVLCVRYAMQQYGAERIDCDVAIVLTVRCEEGEKEKIRLGLNVTVPDEQRYAVVRDHAYNLGQDAPGNGWVTRKYTVRDLSGDAKLQEIGATLESTAANCCLLGEIVVERQTDVTDNVSEDSDEGPDVASDDGDWEPSAKRVRS